jgi:hypothetical protein
MTAPDNQILSKAAVYLPEVKTSAVAISAPGDGPGYWAGASSAVFHDGKFYMAYRIRGPLGQGRGYGNVVAESEDGVHFTTLCDISKDSMNAESLERPSLVRTPEGRWRLYLSCATTGTKHWRVEMLEAASPAEFLAKSRRVVLPGDEHFGVKDNVIRIRDGVWHMWATFHPLDEKGQEDRMTTRYATSSDGVAWQWQGTCLTGRPGMWDSRGARLSAIHFADDVIYAFYDGRASAEENYEERTGLAIGSNPTEFRPIGTDPIGQAERHKGLRYMDIVEMPNGKARVYFEYTRPDGAHDLRTQLLS